MNLKPSSGNGDRYVAALQVSSAGPIHPQETPHTEETGVVQVVATQQHCVDAKPSFLLQILWTRNNIDYRRSVNSTGESLGQYLASSKLCCQSHSRCRTILGAFYGLLFILLVRQSNIIIASISIASFHTCTSLPHFAQRAPRTMILAMPITSIPFQAPTVLAVLPLQSLGVIGHRSIYPFMMRLPLSLSRQ